MADAPGLALIVMLVVGTGLGTFALARSGLGRAALWVVGTLAVLLPAVPFLMAALDTHGQAGLAAFLLVGFFLLPLFLAALFGLALGAALRRLARRR
jgi:hypothetical protein